LAASALRAISSAFDDTHSPAFLRSISVFAQARGSAGGAISASSALTFATPSGLGGGDASASGLCSGARLQSSLNCTAVGGRSGGRWSTP
jgi:hypothetical protein